MHILPCIHDTHLHTVYTCTHTRILVYVHACTQCILRYHRPWVSITSFQNVHFPVNPAFERRSGIKPNTKVRICVGLHYRFRSCNSGSNRMFSSNEHICGHICAHMFTYITLVLAYIQTYVHTTYIHAFILHTYVYTVYRYRRQWALDSWPFINVCFSVACKVQKRGRLDSA